MSDPRAPSAATALPGGDGAAPASAPAPAGADGRAAEAAAPADAGKTNIFDFDRARLERFFEDALGEKKFRAHQVMKWIHHRHVTDFADMTDLGKALRAKLEARAEVRAPQVMFDKASADGTHKWLLGMDAKNAIETVYIPDKGRGTLCVSSQVGCALNCTFCSTATQGFNRNLTTAEIIGQVWVAARHLGNPLVQAVKFAGHEIGVLRLSRAVVEIDCRKRRAAPVAPRGSRQRCCGTRVAIMCST